MAPPPKTTERDPAFPIILTPPKFSGTSEEYEATYLADMMRYANLVSMYDDPDDISSADGSGAYPQAGSGSSVRIQPPGAGQGPRTASTTGVTGTGKPQVPAAHIGSSSARPVPSSGPRLERPDISSNFERLRIVDPLMVQPVSTPVEQLQLALGNKDWRSMMQIAPTLAFKLYTIQLTLDGRQHPHHRGVAYNVALDTGCPMTWLYSHNCARIIPAIGGPSASRDDTHPWTEDEILEWVGPIEKVVPVHHKTGEMLSCEPRGTPGTDEWTTRYVDGSVVYLRHLPEGVLKVNLPCWSWKDNSFRDMPFRLPCVLAFGVNDTMIQRPFHGILGLAVPSQTKLSEDDDVVTMSTRMPFFDALEWRQVNVYEPGKFLIKLNHPDVMDICKRANAHNFLYFGTDWPCTLKPTFTLPISIYRVVRTMPDGSKTSRFLHWAFWMEAISLMVPNGAGGFNEHKISMVEPALRVNKPQLAASQKRILVILDTGSTKTYLPAHVSDEIRDTWLRNTQDIRDIAANKSDAIHSYCGPERDLDGCEIAFAFQGFDGATVNFQCPAKPFLKSSKPLPSERGRAGHTPVRFCSNLGVFTKMQASRLTNRNKSSFQPYILGMNFFWSAFVEHAYQAEGPGSPNATIRLAPQRAKKPDNAIGEAKDFVFLADIAPRQSVPPLET